jgi:hypothetical protein
MKKMMDLSAEQRNEMGQKGRAKMIREFDKRIVVRSYLEAIGEVVHGKS